MADEYKFNEKELDKKTISFLDPEYPERKQAEKDITTLQGDIRGMAGEYSAAAEDIQSRKDKEDIARNLIKAFAAYQGLKKGVDLSKVEVEGTDWDSILSGKAKDIELKKAAMGEELRGKRESLADRIKAGRSLRSDKLATQTREKIAEIQAEMRRKQQEEKASKSRFTSTIGVLNKQAQEITKDINLIEKNIGLALDEKVEKGLQVKHAESRNMLEGVLGIPKEEARRAQDAGVYADLIQRKKGELENRYSMLNTAREIYSKAAQTGSPVSDVGQSVLATLSNAKGAQLNPNLDFLSTVVYNTKEQQQEIAKKKLEKIKGAEGVWGKLASDSPEENALEKFVEEGREALSSEEWDLIKKDVANPRRGSLKNMGAVEQILQEPNIIVGTKNIHKFIK